MPSKARAPHLADNKQLPANATAARGVPPLVMSPLPGAPQARSMPWPKAFGTRGQGVADTVIIVGKLAAGLASSVLGGSAHQHTQTDG